MSKLPKGWANINLGDVCTLLNGRAYNKHELLDSGKYPVLRVGNLFTNPKWYYSDLELEENKYCDNGDLLYAWSASFGPKVWDGPKVIFHYHIWKVVPHSLDLSKQFLFHYFEWDKESIKSEQGTGSTMIHVTKQAMEGREIPLPPYNEQKRIANKVDALFARSDKAKNALDAIPALLDRYRKSILTDAFSGELTKSWRINRDQNVLTYLNAIKIKRMEEAITPSQKKKISTLYEQNDEVEFDIPATWSFARLDKLVSNFSYGSSQKSLPDGDIPVLRMGNIQRGEINWENLVFSSDKNEIKKYTLKPNDVLFNRTNSPELVGKTAIYRGEKPAIYAGYLIRVRPYEILNPEYLNYCLGSQYGRDYCWKVKSDGVSQSNINAKKLAAFKVPLCCPEEQSLIVKIIKEHFSFIESIELQCNNASNQISPLKGAILAKAFQGKLVPQDPNDEPASVLLKRIQIEHEKFEKELKGKKKVAIKKSKGNKKKMIIPVLDALKQSEKPLSAQELLSAAGYPNNADTDQIEQFFLDIRKAINEMQIETWRENDQDYFNIAG